MQKKRVQKSEKKKKKNTHSLHLDSKKKHFFQLAYSSIGLGNRLGVFTDLHFKFVIYFLFLCLFHLLHGLLLECWVLVFFFFLLNFCLVVLVLFTLYSFLFVLLNFDFFRFLQNAMEWSEWTHLIFYFFIFKKSDLVDGS